MNENFEFFLNAVHYMIYKEEVRSNKKIEMFLKSHFSFIPKYLFTPRMKIRFFRRQIRARKEMNEYMYGKHYGQSISMAHHLFGTFYSGYTMFWSWIFIGVINKFCSPLHVRGIIAFIVLGIPLAIGYLPAYKAVFSHDRYLSFFKQFERKDKKWYRKWKIRSIIFCASGIIAAILGFLLMVAIEHL